MEYQPLPPPVELATVIPPLPTDRSTSTSCSSRRRRRRHHHRQHQGQHRLPNPPQPTHTQEHSKDVDSPASNYDAVSVPLQSTMLPSSDHPEMASTSGNNSATPCLSTPSRARTPLARHANCSADETKRPPAAQPAHRVERWPRLIADAKPAPQQTQNQPHSKLKTRMLAVGCTALRGNASCCQKCHGGAVQFIDAEPGPGFATLPFALAVRNLRSVGPGGIGSRDDDGLRLLVRINPRTGAQHLHN